MAKQRPGGLAWSSAGDVCARCRRPAVSCTCRREPPPPAGDGIVRVGRQTKGRRGAGVTVITGVPLAGGELKAYALALMGLCGAGGTVKNGAIEIQGDHRDRLVPVLERNGWTVRRAGG